MATWHQSQNQAAIKALWTPHATKWKCISDKHDRPASCMTFDDRKSAKEYAERTGDILIAPRITKRGYFLAWVGSADEARRERRQVFSIKSREPEEWAFA